MGEVTRPTVQGAMVGWVLHHAVAWWDPAYFEVPFLAVTTLAVVGLAVGIDRRGDGE